MAGDTYQLQWNLKPRIEALRVEAAGGRKQLNESYTTRGTELGIARDRAAREQYAAEQAAKSAEIQVTVENREAAKAVKEYERLDAAAAKAEQNGNRAEAADYREDAAANRAVEQTHLARARQATLDGAESKEQAATLERRKTELEVERKDLSRNSGAAENEFDKLDEQAALLEQARQEYARADLAGDDGSRAESISRAESLVAKAEAIEVDRAAIRVMVPEFPDTTPGIDAPPPPLPEGADDVSAAERTDADDDVSGTGMDTVGDDDVAVGTDGVDDTNSDETFEPINDGSFEAADSDFDFTSSADQFAAPDTFPADQFAAGDTDDEFSFSEPSETIDSSSFGGDELAGETLDG